jgi:hypothetical protein
MSTMIPKGNFQMGKGRKSRTQKMKNRKNQKKKKAAIKRKISAKK